MTAPAFDQGALGESDWREWNPRAKANARSADRKSGALLLLVAAIGVWLFVRLI